LGGRKEGNFLDAFLVERKEGSLWKERERKRGVSPVDYGARSIKGGGGGGRGKPVKRRHEKEGGGGRKSSIIYIKKKQNKSVRGGKGKGGLPPILRKKFT